MTEKMKSETPQKKSALNELLKKVQNSSVQHVNCGQDLNKWMNENFEKYEK